MFIFFLSQAVSNPQFVFPHERHGLECISRRVASRTGDLQDGQSCVASTASLGDIRVSLVTWSAQRSGGRPLGRRHDDGGVEANTSMDWVGLPGCKICYLPEGTQAQFAKYFR